MEDMNFEINQNTEFQRMCHLLASSESEVEFLKKLSAKELFALRGKFSESCRPRTTNSFR